jgi:pseudouridylate synthase
MSVELSSEVSAAIHERRPVVALESTVITHGLPYPQNLKTAIELEETVRSEGCTPATIAVIGGLPRVGLEAKELELLATSEQIKKLSRRDLAIAVARRQHGATTVAATMVIAAMAGVRVFATGGIGGVHRGNPQDISADLPELVRTPMVVVCAGAKAILDLPATLEWLETHGVPVLGYETAQFPAFYSAVSGLLVDERVDTPEEVAAIARTQWELNLGAGLLVTVPPPAEWAMPPNEMEAAITTALRSAGEANVRGKAVTPFLLREMSRLTAGASLAANLALLGHNAQIASRIAVALQRA